MANAKRKHVHTRAQADEFDGFPRGAFEYDDDVTIEAVDSMRKRAQGVIGAEEWVVVDGFGSNHPAA